MTPTALDLYKWLEQLLSAAPKERGYAYPRATPVTASGERVEVRGAVDAAEIHVRVHLGTEMGETSDSYVAYDYTYVVSPTDVIGSADRTSGPRGGFERRAFAADHTPALDKLLNTLFDPDHDSAPWVRIPEAIQLAGWGPEASATAEAPDRGGPGVA